MFAFLGGAAAGAITALLTAPASGQETRARLRAHGLHGNDRAHALPGALKAAAVAAEEAFVTAFKEAEHDSKHRHPIHRHS